MRNAVGIAALALVVAGASAQAATVEQIQSFNNVGSQTLNFDGFDSSLGTLTRVRARVSGTAEIAAGEISGIPWATSSDPRDPDFEFSGTIGGTVQVSSAGFNITDSLFGPRYRCGSRNECTARYGADSDTFSGSGGAASGANFIDQSVRLRVSTSRELYREEGRPTSSPSTHWMASGALTLIYTYDPVGPEPGAVPLPAGLPLLLAGLGALGLARCRRRG